MQIIENWTDLRGSVLSIAPHPSLKGFLQLKVKVECTEPVDDYPDLLQLDPGEIVHLAIPESATVTSPTNENRFRGRVRLARGRRYFVHRIHHHFDESTAVEDPKP